ncbi:MAG: DUF1553 domain-containing protein [Planctomycetales bacterium]
MLSSSLNFISLNSAPLRRTILLGVLLCAVSTHDVSRCAVSTPLYGEEKTKPALAANAPTTEKPTKEKPGIPPRKLEPRVPPDAHPLKTTDPVVQFINEQIRTQWKENEVIPSPFADDSEWLRRVNLDIVGHIPNEKTATEFLREGTKNDDRREKLLEELLSSPDFARNFASQWANLLVGRRPPNQIDRAGLQKFLQEQFEKNRPWNEIVRALITAEGSQRENGAVNFLLAHLNDGAVPATSLSARLFLGTQIQCTQCHNHPFNDWKQNQFWELNSFFVQMRRVEHRKPNPTTGQMEFDYAELVPTNRGGPVYFEQRNGLAKVAYPKYEDQEISPESGVNRRQELAKLMTREDSEPLARAFVNRLWAHFFGVGFVRPVDDLGPHKPPSHPEILDRLTREFVAAKFDVKRLVRWICQSEAYQLTSQEQGGNTKDDPAAGSTPLFSHMQVKSLTAEQLYDSMMIATYAYAGENPRWDEWDRERQGWMQQFVQNLGTDENDESTTFNGTIPQALMMMNGALMRNALNPEKTGLLKELVSSSQKDTKKVQRLYLATLNRVPSGREMNAARNILSGSGGEIPALQDLLWALLNCNEFISNH